MPKVYPLAFSSTVTTFRLHSLTLGYYLPDIGPPASSLYQFLTSQTELHDVCHYRFHELAPDALPYLETVTASGPACRDLFLGRSIRCLNLVPSLSSLRHSTRSLEPIPGISSLRELSITPYNCLIPLKECFQFLERLFIETVCV